MRKMIFDIVCSKLPKGSILPWWAVIIWSILFPLKFLYWKMGKRTGYQVLTDTWLIDGITYSSQELHDMAQGGTYRVSRNGNTVKLERVYAE